MCCHRLLLAFLIFAKFTADPRGAKAMWFEGKSLEWWTHVSDCVLVAQVRGATPERIDCVTSAYLKGTGRPDQKLALYPSSNHKAEEGQEVIAFLAKSHRVMYVREWFNLSDLNSDTVMVTDRWTIPRSRDEVLRVVTAQAEADAKDPVRKRAVIRLTYMEEDERTFSADTHVELWCTPTEELKQLQLRRLGWLTFREFAIYNLVSYPTDDVRGLLRAKLEDPYSVATVVDRPTGKIKVQYYGVRQAAYLALKLLGEDPEEPEDYVPERQPQIFFSGSWSAEGSRPPRDPSREATYGDPIPWGSDQPLLKAETPLPSQSIGDHPPPDANRESETQTRTIFWLVGSVVALIGLATIVFICCRWHRGRRRGRVPTVIHGKE